MASEPRRSARGIDALFVALVLAVLVLMAVVVADQHRLTAEKNAAAGLPAMRSIDPQRIREGVQKGRLSDHEAKFYKQWKPEEGAQQ